VARSIGCEVTHWEARPENGWAPDLDELERSLRSNTRLVIVNTPHNPTGYLMPQDDFRQLNRMLQERGVLLFSDEVYRGLEYDPADRLPAACEINPSAVSLGVMSKTYGLAGLRLGWVATQDASVYERMAGVKDYTTICTSAPSEYLAELALRCSGRIVGRNLGIIRDNLSLLEAFFAAHPDLFEWVRPKAGPIAFPRFLGGEIEPFCHDLVTASGVLLLPGTMYDHPGNHFRLGFARRNLPQALEQLEGYLDHLPGREPAK
jgi:aspartate/methionine/tyrosine aminotransferase